MRFLLRLTLLLPDVLADPRRLDDDLLPLALRRGGELPLVDLGELAVLQVAEARHRLRVHQLRLRELLLC